MADAQIRAVISAKDEASGVLSKFGSGIGSAVKAIGAGVAVAGAAVTAFGVASVKAFSESENLIAQTNAVLKSTGGIAGVTADQVDKLSKSLQATTKFSDEEVRSAENLLLTFTAIGKDIFPQATKTVLNMATALGEDTKSASIQLGKALQDPILGITALRRVGVNFSDAQKDVIQKLVDTGKKAEAQKLILKELETEFGGSAEAAGKTFAGSLVILKNNFNDVMEVIGQGIVGAINPFIRKLADFVATERFKLWVDETTKFMSNFFARLGDLAARAIPLFIKALQDLQIIGAIVWDKIKLAIDFLWPSVQTLWQNLQVLADKLKQVFIDMSPLLKLIGETVGAGIVGAMWLLVNAANEAVKAIIKFSDWAHAHRDVLNEIGTIIFPAIAGYMASIAAKALVMGGAQVISALVKFGVASASAIAPWLELAAVATLLERAYKIIDELSRVKTNFTLWEQIKSLTPYLKSIGGLRGGVTSADKRASGGTVNMNTPYLVGEKGPEMFVPGRTGTIIPNDKMTATTSTQATVNISLNGVFTGTPQEARKLANMVLDNLKDVANAKNMTLAELMR